MPDTTAANQDFISLVNYVNGTNSSGGLQPSSALEEALNAASSSPVDIKLVLQLNIYIMELLDKATATQLLMQPWKATFDQIKLDRTKQEVLIYFRSPGNPAGLTPEQSSYLCLLNQLVSFAHFLKSQENDPAYEDKEVQIKELRLKIMLVGCLLRKLLPLTNEEVKNYLVQGSANRVLSLKNSGPIVKRVVCCIVIEVMLNVLQKIQVPK